MGSPEQPAISHDLGAVGKVIILCDNVRNYHAYTLGVYGPARGLKAGNWRAAKISGKTVHVKVQIDSKGGATLTATSMTTRYADNMSETYDVIEAMRRTRKPITITSGAFSLIVPREGFEAALVPLVRVCGDPGKLSRQVKARAEP